MLYSTQREMMLKLLFSNVIPWNECCAFVSLPYSHILHHLAIEVMIHIQTSKMSNVPANNSFVERIFEMSQGYLSRGIVNTCQRDPGMLYQAATSDKAIVNSWTRATNDRMVSSASDMLAGLVSMNIN